MSRTESSMRLELVAPRSRFVRSTDRAAGRRAADTGAGELSPALPALCSGAQGTRPRPADTPRDPLSGSGPRARSPALFQRTEPGESDIRGPDRGITVSHIEEFQNQRGAPAPPSSLARSPDLRAPRETALTGGTAGSGNVVSGQFLGNSHLSS